MRQQEFIDAIRLVVEQGAVDDILSSCESPPGRRPSTDSLELSAWFHRLSPDDKEMLARVLREAAHSSVFGLLCVLDGVRAVENRPDKGSFELWYVNGGERRLINGPDDDFLHDTYNAV